MIENPYQILMGILAIAIGIRYLVAVFVPATRPRFYRTGEERMGAAQCTGAVITFFGLAIIAFIHDPANPPRTIYFVPTVVGLLTFGLARILEAFEVLPSS